jgi:hypothetical protein
MKPDIMKIYAANGGALAITMPTYTASQVETFLKCAVLVATLVYTGMKCWKLAREDKFNKDDE